jgi:3-oxoacyl-[acyl-carrier-protein] synthase II
VTRVTRVAITGIGAVTPLGLDVPSTWAAAKRGESGIDWISSFDTEGLPVRVAGEVKGFDPTQVVSAKEARKLERNVLFGVAAGREAVDDANLGDLDPSRIGIIFGSAIGGVPGIVEQALILRERGPDRVSPNFLPNVLVDSVSGQLAISLGITGPNYAVVSACATGSHAVGEAAEMIKRGAADAVLAGGTEACIVPLILAGFTAMRGLATDVDGDPTRASRPFDATRAGFVMSEGAGALLLEDWDRAEARGADIYAEVLGYGASNDAHHMAQPEPAATGVASMMRTALERAGIDPKRVGYLNAHGTSTPQGDLAETKAIKDVFGAHAYDLAVSSTKSMTGHTFGAAGAIEAIFSALALRHGVLPPTINYREPDPDCDLDYVPNEAREATIDVALSNAMGLGGHNGCVLLGRAT